MELLEGEIVDDRWRIRKRLGEGGFGTVYEAVDEQLGRTVAIKVLRESLLSDASIRRRFLREGKILASVQSPNLVRLFSVNVSNNGMLYMVMELVSGRTVRSELIERGRIPEAEVLTIARGVAGALKTLESFGVVHRDLKPDNVMLDRVAGGEIQTKVLDFGLSALRSNDIKDSYATTEGTMLGSVYYMAPENCMGQKTDIRGDFYSLGCLLYECLTGEPPFFANDPVAVVFRQVNDPMSVSPLKAARVSAETTQLLLRLLQKEPTLRYRSGTELMEAVDSCIAGKMPEGFIAVADTLAKRTVLKRIVLPAVAVVLVLCVCFGAAVQHVIVIPCQSFLTSEDNNSKIVLWSEKIVAEKPNEDAKIIELNNRLRQLTQPSPSRTEAAAKWESYSQRFDYLAKSLASAFDNKSAPPTEQELDAALVAMRRLHKLRLNVSMQSLCLSALKSASRNTFSANAAIFSTNTRLREVAAFLAEGGSGLVDRPAAVDHARSLVFEVSADSDFKINVLLAFVALHIDESDCDFLLRHVKTAMESSSVALLQSNEQLMVEVFDRACVHKNSKIVDLFLPVMFRARKSIDTEAQLAEWCSSRGNNAASVNRLSGAPFWKRAVEGFEKIGLVNISYIGSLINLSSCFLEMGQFNEAKTAIWKDWKAMHTANDYPFSFKIHWQYLARQLPDQDSKSRLAQLAENEKEPWWNSINSNERIVLGKVRCDFLADNKQFADVGSVARKTLRLRRNKDTPVTAIYDLKRHLLSSVLNSNPFDRQKAQAILSELESDPGSSKQEIAGFYAEAAGAALGSVTGQCDPEGSAYSYFVQRSFEAEGASRSIAVAYGRAHFFINCGAYEKAERILRRILWSSDAESLSDHSLICFVHCLTLCELYLGQSADAIKTLEKGLKRSPTADTFNLGVACYIRNRRIASASAMAEQASLRRDFPQSTCSLIAQCIRLIQEQPAEATSTLDALSEHSDTLKLVGLKPLVRSLRAWQLAETGKLSDAKKTLDSAIAGAKQNEFAQKLYLAKYCIMSGRFEYAQALLREASATKEFVAVSPVQRRKFYTDMAICQSALHQDAEAAQSRKLANSW